LNIPSCGRVKNPSIGLRQLIEKTPRLFLTRFFVYFFIEKSKARPAGQNNLKELQTASLRHKRKPMITTTTTITNNELQATNNKRTNPFEHTPLRAGQKSVNRAESKGQRAKSKGQRARSQKSEAHSFTPKSQTTKSNSSNIPSCGRVKNPSIGLRQPIEKTPRLFLTRFFVYFFIEKSKARPAGQNNLKELQATS
jgi:outer membrane protein OmpA-like peptidoglycan-associated protein